VKNLIYCSNCGSQIADDAYFCPKCGTKTETGKAAKAVYPTDQLRDSFYQVGIELEKAFNIAARETHSAIQRAKENWQQSQPYTQQQNVTCSKCTTNNPNGSVFCRSCGTRLGPNEESHGSS
jgi:uncharacterized membrane protein YvbJ